MCFHNEKAIASLLGNFYHGKNIRLLGRVVVEMKKRREK
jgi:hypothetical protein